VIPELTPPIASFARLREEIELCEDIEVLRWLAKTLVDDLERLEKETTA